MPAQRENGDGSAPFDHVAYNDSTGTAESGSPPVKWRAANARFSSYVGGANSAFTSPAERKSCKGQRMRARLMGLAGSPSASSSCSALRAASRKPAHTGCAVNWAHSSRSTGAKHADSTASISSLSIIALPPFL